MRILRGGVEINMRLTPDEMRSLGDKLIAFASDGLGPNGMVVRSVDGADVAFIRESSALVVVPT